MVYAYWHFVGIWHSSLSILNFGPWCPSSTSPWHSGREKGKGYAVFMKCALAACCVCGTKAPMTLTIWAVDRGGRCMSCPSALRWLCTLPSITDKHGTQVVICACHKQLAAPAMQCFLKCGRHIWANLNFLLAATTWLCCFSSHPPPFWVFDVLLSLRLHDTQQKQIISVVQFWPGQPSKPVGTSKCDSPTKIRVWELRLRHSENVIGIQIWREFNCTCGPRNKPLKTWAPLLQGAVTSFEYDWGHKKPFSVNCGSW